MYVYCNNNPVIFVDVFGDEPIHFMNLRFRTLFANHLFELYQGWKYRIDTANPPAKVKKHIHIIKYGNDFSQNEDGSSHHGYKGDPPKKIRRILKEKGIWDWDANSQKIDPNKLQKYIVISYLFLKGIFALFPKSVSNCVQGGEILSAEVMLQQEQMVRMGIGLLIMPFHGISGFGLVGSLPVVDSGILVPVR